MFNKSVARSLSAALKNGGGAGANNVSRLEHDRTTVSQYESLIQDLQQKIQSLEGKVSPPQPQPQKRGAARSENRSPAKEPPFKKGWVDVAADPWKKIFQIAGECWVRCWDFA